MPSPPDIKNGATPAPAELLVPLPRSFYLPSAESVGPSLLGHYLLRQTDDGLIGGRIVEVEAYLRDDPASHSYNNRSARTETMWGEPGHAYVYQIYGMHYCINTACLPRDTAEGVLIRAIDVVYGETAMQARRPVDPRNLTNGPAKLCAAMHIDRALNGVDLCDARSPVFIARNPLLESFLAESGPVVRTTRIGITKAAALPLRWYLEGSASVSKRAPKAVRR